MPCRSIAPRARDQQSVKAKLTSDAEGLEKDGGLGQDYGQAKMMAQWRTVSESRARASRRDDGDGGRSCGDRSRAVVRAVVRGMEMEMETEMRWRQRGLERRLILMPRLDSLKSAYVSVMPRLTRKDSCVSGPTSAYIISS